MKSPLIDNAMLSKTLRLLVHPLTIAALALLLANDHLLRVVQPSILTGKLGDFAWLFFAPFAVAALMAVLAPPPVRKHAWLIPVLAFAAVGVTFSLAKTVPAAHAAIVAAATRLLGFQVGWRRDPSDLVALTALAASALLWIGTPEPPATARKTAPGGAGWVALAAAMLLTVGNSPAPDPGIYCLDARAGELEAYSGYSTYRSTDGGSTWQSLPNQPRGACPNPWSDTSGAAQTTIDPGNEQRQYRITPGRTIELSVDGGTSWRTVYQIPTVSEASAAATRRRLSSYAMLRPVPLDGKVDRGTGNAVFAMGQAGVLVHEGATGAWREAAVGPYRPIDVNAPSDFLGLLVGEMLLAVALALLGFDTLATRLFVRGKVLWILALVVAWFIWAAVVLLAPPAMTYGYGSLITYGALLVLGLILVVMTVVALVGALQRANGNVRAALGRPSAVAVGAGVAFFLPYALWATGTLPGYAAASVLGAVLGILVIVLGARWAGNRQERAG